MLISSPLLTAFGQTAVTSSYTFDYRMNPGQLIENTDGVLQVDMLQSGTSGANAIMVPQKIQNLIVTSSDSSIIQVLGVEDGDGFVKNVKIHANNPGTANIALAAPGFASLSFSVTVYSNKIFPTELLIQATPNTFTQNGPNEGYYAVELADSSGFPTVTNQDMKITITTSDPTLINLDSNQLVIKQGSYFATGHFETKSTGTALIYASNPSMTTVSSKITVSSATTPLKLQLYVFPNRISTQASSSAAYAMVELQDASGNPVKSQENIPITLKMIDTSQSANNLSTNANVDLTKTSTLEIPKGSYWAYTQLVPNPGVNTTYNVQIAASNYEVSAGVTLPAIVKQLTSVIPPVRVNIMPVLATGQKELIGVLLLDNGTSTGQTGGGTGISYPFTSNQDIKYAIDSSDSQHFSVDPVTIPMGSSAAPIFANVGYIQPSSLQISVQGQGNTTVTPIINGPQKSGLTLTAQPLIPQVLVDHDFPVAIFLSDGTASRYFPDDLTLNISPSQYMQIQSQNIQHGSSILLLNAKAVKAGADTISFTTTDYVSTSSMTIVSSKPSAINLVSPLSILSSSKFVFSVETLDSTGAPIFAQQDMPIKLVSNNPSVITLPDTVTIKQGQYYAMVEGQANTPGQVEIAALASELTLTKAQVTVTANPLAAPAPAAPATPAAPASPAAPVQPSTETSGSSSSNQDTGTGSTGSILDSFNIMGINLIFIIVPVAGAVGAFLVLKKKNMLEGLSEKLVIRKKDNF